MRDARTEVRVNQGDLLQERYRIVRHIKKGGMGAVYEARDTKLADSPCAVKEILETARLGQDSQYIEARFFQEMKALAALDHACIPKVRDYLTVDSVVYIVMDLIQGQSLEEEIEQSMGLTGQPLPPDKCVEDILALLETVDYLHQQDPPILHRDIKPANVLRETRSGRIKLVDFGLARQLDENSRHTLVGTLGYCAPEQMMGKASLQSDLYSVGVTLHHLLTGRRPETISFDPLHLDLEGLRPGLAEIVEKATQPRPAERYTSCREMRLQLEAWLKGKPLSARLTLPEPPPTTTLPPSPSRTPLLAGVTAVGVALFVGLWMGRQTATHSPVSAKQTPVLSQPSPPSPVAQLPTAPAPAPPSVPATAHVPPPPPVKVPPPAPRRVTAPIAAPHPPELEPAPAYPTYQAPPVEPPQAAVFQAPGPEPVIQQEGRPDFPSSAWQAARNRRQINRFRRNHRRGQ